ncbi:MAG: DUF6014 family protein [Pyrinomonadaceae bacterium]
MLTALEVLSRDLRYPVSWIDANIKGLLTGNYSGLTAPFCEMQFVGPQGHFALAGPYMVLREARSDEKLSGLVGHTLAPPDLPPLEGHVEKLLGPLRQAIPRMVPVEVEKSWGHLSGESGEAFVVPSAWDWMKSAELVGPAINNMTEQRRRWEEAGFECVERIFDADSAKLLLSPLLDRKQGIAVQSREYQLHDCGHAAGLGLDHKLEEGLLNTPMMQGVEEWRADGVDFELAAQALSPEEAYEVVASNMVTRFGLDAHRGGGLDRDYDVTVVALTLDRLLKGRALRLRGGRLSFADPTPRGLLRAVELHRAEAVQLTRDELALDYHAGLARLYGAIAPSPAAEEIFRAHVVEPCCGLFTQLR